MVAHVYTVYVHMYSLTLSPQIVIHAPNSPMYSYICTVLFLNVRINHMKSDEHVNLTKAFIFLTLAFMYICRSSLVYSLGGTILLFFAAASSAHRSAFSGSSFIDRHSVDRAAMQFVTGKFTIRLYDGHCN